VLADPGRVLASGLGAHAQEETSLGVQLGVAPQDIEGGETLLGKIAGLRIVGAVKGDGQGRRVEVKAGVAELLEIGVVAFRRRRGAFGTSAEVTHREIEASKGRRAIHKEGRRAVVGPNSADGHAIVTPG
jgi:hypothetical protein